jgi:hypothetical protein
VSYVVIGVRSDSMCLTQHSIATPISLEIPLTNTGFIVSGFLNFNFAIKYLGLSVSLKTKTITFIVNASS